MKTVLLSSICALTGVLLGTAVSDLVPNAQGDSATKEFSTNSPPRVELERSKAPIPSYGTEGGRQSKVKSRIELRGGQIHLATEQNFGALAETVTGIEVVSDSGRPIHEQLNKVALQGETSRTDSLELPALEDGYYIVRSSNKTQIPSNNQR